MFPEYEPDQFDFMWGSSVLPKNEVIPFIISKRGCCNLKITVDETTGRMEKKRLLNDNIFLISSRNLRAFMEEYSDGKIILETKDSNEDKTRIKIFNFAVDFLRKHVGDFPTEEEKTSLLNALKYLFPDFSKIRDKLFRSYLNEKMRNIRRKINESNKDSANCSKKRKPEDEKMLQNIKKKMIQEFDEKLEWLKNANVLTDGGKIREYLQITIEARLKEAKTANFSVLESYSIFHCDTNLVIF